MNLEELQALMSEGSTEKEDVIKQKIEEVKALSRSGELAGALSALKALKNEIRDYSSAVSNVNNFKDGNVNRLIDVFTSVISLPENYNKLVLPNTNTILTSISDKLDQNPITSTGLFSPLTSNRVYGDNIESKRALGIDAKLNTMQKEFQIAGLVYTNEYSTMYPFAANRVSGGISLGEQTLTDGTIISRVISETINGHVDIAKEDWIILLGLDKAKTPLFHAMILAGTPVQTALDFLKKPLVKYVLKESTRGLLFKQMGVRRGRKVDTTFKEVLIDTLEKLNVLPESMKFIKGSIQRDLYENIKVKPTIMALNASLGFITNNKDAALAKDIVDLFVIKELQSSIQQLTGLVDFNTKRFQNSYQVKADAITYTKIVDSFNKEGLRKLTRDSALANFNQAGTVNAIMPQVFDVSNHPSVLSAISQYTLKAGKYTEDDLVKSSKKIKDNYLVAMVQLFGVDQLGTKLQDKFFSASGLFNKTNPNNIAKKLADLTEKYSDLSKNQIISNLYTAENPSKNIIFKLRNANLNSYLIGEYEKAFIEGLNDVREDVSDLFKNIGLGTFLQFGFSNNQYGLSQVVPYETYVDQTTKAVNKLKSIQQDQVVAGELAKYIAQMTYFNDSRNVPTLILDKDVARKDYEPDFLIKLGRAEKDLDIALNAILAFQPSNVTTQSSTSTNTINIYSTDDNGFKKLSNLLNGPVKATLNNKEHVFKTIEHLYQVKKALFAGDIETANKIFAATTGFDAQKLSKDIVGLNSEAWDKISSQELESAMRLAFEQNQSAKNLLLSTGTANLTHKTKFNLGKWETVFPEILMKIRKESIPTQPSTSVAEFDLADTLPPIAQNFKDGTGGRKMQPQFKDKSTMDLIISGDRTRTTRAKTDKQRMAKDYGLSKISDLVGKVIRMTDKTGRQVYTTITNVVPFTQEYQDATWQNEGWEKSVTDKHVGDYPYAIEFEVVDKPTQPSTSATDQNITDPFNC